MSESKAVFKSRALEVGIEEADLDLLEAGNVSTFGQFAFVCPFAPGSTDESPLVDALSAILGTAPPPAKMIAFRRLYYESHAIAVSEMKSKLERTAADTPKQMPLAERVLRLKRQREELKGVIFDASSEPSHALVDKVQTMLEEGVLTYLPPNKCPSREQEVAKDRQEHTVSFAADGSLKIARKTVDLHCDAVGEIKIRSALTRRSLAFDQIGLLSFVVHEKWHSKDVCHIAKGTSNGAQVRIDAAGVGC